MSFAFNAPDRLNVDTATRIRSIAEQLDYRPDPVARMLAQRRTGTIGILTPQGLDVMFTNPYFGSFVAGIATAAESAAYTLQFISPLRGSLVRALHQATVDGFVAYGLSADHPEIGQVRRSGLPFVLIDSTALPDELTVSVDDEVGARRAADYLIALGHRRFAILALEPPLHALDDEPAEDGSAAQPARRGRDRLDADDASSRRLRGYLGALDAAGIDLPDSAIVYAPSTLARGALAFQELYEAGQRPTAVLAMSDALAIGVLRAAAALDLRVPEDLSVVGFDDIDVAAFTDPSLTTVHQPGRKKGEAAMRLLLGRLQRTDATDATRLQLETKLVVRGSTGPGPGIGREVSTSKA